MRILLPVAKLFPRWGRIKWGSSAPFCCNALRNNPALPNLSLYGELFKSSRALVAADGVLFCLLLRHALGDDGGCIGGDRALVVDRLRRINQNLGELLILVQTFEVITPEASLRLEVQAFAQSGLEIRFLAVDISWEPRSGAQVQSPTVEMEEEIDLGLGIIAAIAANDIVILVFDPDPAHEARDLLAFLGLDIDD